MLVAFQQSQSNFTERRFTNKKIIKPSIARWPFCFVRRQQPHLNAHTLGFWSNKNGGDKLYDFVRYAITTLLNEAGVPNYSTPSGLFSDIADWLIAYGPKTLVGGNWVLKYNNLSEPNNGSSQDGPRDGFPAGSQIKANSAAWQTGNGVVPAGSEIFAAMTSLTDDAVNNAVVVSLNGSYVFSAVNYGNYYGIRTGTQNVTDGYLLLV
jgi:hypothetical protein